MEAFTAWPRAVDALLAHLQRERDAQRAQGNLRAGNRAFVGREQPLRNLHRMLALGKPGVVSAVQGLGGIGKTELALQYGHEYAWHYSGGLWMLGAEGQRELLPVLGRLGEDPVFRHLHGRDGRPFEFTEAERADAHAQGRRVLHEMLERAQRLRDHERHVLADVFVGLAAAPERESRGGGAVLVILDNVDQPDLLSQAQLQHWPELNQGHECIRFLATSRVGADQWQASAVEVLPLDRLDRDEALALMQRHREGRPWPDDAYESGVQALLELLDGYTLLIEQVALYLALNDEVRPDALLEVFRTSGLTVGDALHTYDDRLEGAVRHREKLFAIVLDQTLRTLDGVPLARAALEYAAWLAPEHVPWSWLEALVQSDDPGAFDSPPHVPTPWSKAVKRLRLTQLLVDAGGGAARLHRLIGDHLRARPEPGVRLRRIERVEALVRHRAAELERSHDAPPETWPDDRVWIRDVAFHWMRINRRTLLAGQLAGTSAKFEQYLGSMTNARELAEAAVSCRESLYVGSGTEEHGLALATSLIRLGDCLMSDRQWPRAEQIYTRAAALVEGPLAASPRMQHLLANSLYLLAESIFTHGVRSEAHRAAATAARSVTLNDGLLGDDPSDENKLSLVASLTLRAKIELWRHRSTSARQDIDRGFALCDSLGQLTRPSVTAKLIFAELQQAAAEQLKAQKDPTALDQQRNALETFRALARDGATDSHRYLRCFVVGLLRCHDLEVSFGQPEARQRCLDIVRVLENWKSRGLELDAFLDANLARAKRLLGLGP